MVYIYARMKKPGESARAKNKTGPKPLDGLKPAFIQAFRQSGFVLQTCNRVGVKRDVFVRWLENDPAFAKEFEVANDYVTEHYELAAGKRAVEGWQEPVFHQGKQVGTVTRYSDRLLELLLKARNRTKYGERIDYHVDEEAIASAIASRFVAIVRRVAPDVCPGCKTHLGISAKIAEEMLSLSTKISPKVAAT